MSVSFGEMLKEWRGLRRFSQLELSLEAATSARHVSFLESGRANPSRNMILQLADALKMPRAIVNQAMLAAGFAPIYPQLDMDDNRIAPMQAVIDMMLENHAPYPAVALDRHWNAITINPPAATLFSAIGGTSANMIEALIEAGTGGDIIENWEEVAALAMMRLKTEIFHHGGDKELEAHAKALAAHPRLRDSAIEEIDLSQPIIPTIFLLGDNRLSFVTTITQFGTVQDVSLGDVRIEMMFPADQKTKQYFQNA